MKSFLKTFGFAVLTTTSLSITALSQAQAFGYQVMNPIDQIRYKILQDRQNLNRINTREYCHRSAYDFNTTYCNYLF